MLDWCSGGDIYSSYYEMYVTQHDVLRDLALHFSSQENVNDRKRLLMPRREAQLPKEWERNAERPFDAQIVSIHTGISIAILGCYALYEVVNLCNLIEIVVLVSCFQCLFLS